MNYNFDFAMSATISPPVIKEMITKIVQDQTGRKVKTIEFKMKSVTKGHQRDEYEELVFDGVVVTFDNAAVIPAGPIKRGVYGDEEKKSKCPNKNEKGACTQHNLHCGYPDCEK